MFSTDWPLGFSADPSTPLAGYPFPCQRPSFPVLQRNFLNTQPVIFFQAMMSLLRISQTYHPVCRARPSREDKLTFLRLARCALYIQIVYIAHRVPAHLARGPIPAPVGSPRV